MSLNPGGHSNGDRRRRQLSLALLMVGLSLGLGVCARSSAQAQPAQGVVLAGRMGEKALLVVRGRAHSVAPGTSVDGVRLLRWLGDDAEVQTSSGRLVLRSGATPALLGPQPFATDAREVSIAASPDGHFMPAGAINGIPVRFVVDTGATLVGMGQDEAARLGLDLSEARQGISQTANGPVPVRIVVLERVRVGGVEIRGVGAVVLPQPMPYILLGNSFLNRFQMRSEAGMMRLELR